MTFPTDGSSHANGKKNEELTKNRLNELNIFEQEVVLLGGTKNKADAVCERNLSIKRWKGGTHDWVNTSTGAAIVSSYFSEWFEQIKELRQEPEDVRKVAKKIEENEFNSICSKAIDSITSDQITDFLNEYLISDCKDFLMVITEVKKNKLHIYEFNDHPVNKLIRENYIPTLKNKSKKAKGSRTIIFEKDGESVDIGLRLRVTSNNGVSAFLGLSKANNNSQLVLKLQQDNPQFILNSVPHDTYAAS